MIAEDLDKLLVQTLPDAETGRAVKWSVTKDIK